MMTFFPPVVVLVLCGLCYASAQFPALFPYEIKPETDGGFTYVGGDGGSDFTLNVEGSAVKMLSAWFTAPIVGQPTMEAIRLQFFDGQVKSVGTFPPRAADREITFAVGETLTGNYIISGLIPVPTVDSRVVYIKFTTNKEQTFEIGKPSRPYYFNSGESFLMGLFGAEGDIVDALGFIMMKPFEDFRLIDVTYDMAGYNISAIPARTDVTQNINNSSGTQTYTFTWTRGDSTRKEYSTTNSWSHTIGFTVEAAFPKIFTIGASYELAISTETTFTNEEVNTEEISQEFSATNAPCTNTSLTLIWFENRKQFRFNGTVRFTFTDRTTFDLPANGMFDNILTSTLRTVTTESPIISSDPKNACFREGATTPKPPTKPPTKPPKPNKTDKYPMKEKKCLKVIEKRCICGLHLVGDKCAENVSKAYCKAKTDKQYYRKVINAYTKKCFKERKG